MQDILTQKLEKYLSLTKEALDKIKFSDKLSEEQSKQARDLLNLSNCYFDDALHFKEKGDLVNAYGAVCYAHCFLDVGARIKLFDVDDNRLFMVDKKNE